MWATGSDMYCKIWATVKRFTMWKSIQDSVPYVQLAYWWSVVLTGVTQVSWSVILPWVTQVARSVVLAGVTRSLSHIKLELYALDSLLYDCVSCSVLDNNVHTWVCLEGKSNYPLFYCQNLKHQKSRREQFSQSTAMSPIAPQGFGNPGNFLLHFTAFGCLFTHIMAVCLLHVYYNV